MSEIRISNLTFYYEGSYEEIFSDVSLSIDSAWRLGFIGRNGRGKTTFLKLLQGEYVYRGSITSTETFRYFPFAVADGEKTAYELSFEWNTGAELWQIVRELRLLKLDDALLYRPFATLSKGEQTRVMLAVLFASEDGFLLIDEPTNHLDAEGRRVVAEYLKSKSGFILVSHDRALLDACVDHILSINRNSMELVRGNFSSWWENRQKQEQYERQQNERLKKDIGRLQTAARRSAGWSDAVERTKNAGKKQAKEVSAKPDRGYVGHKAAKMMKRAKNLEKRQHQLIEEKQGLLRDIETSEALKLTPQKHDKDCLLRFQHVSLGYETPLFTDLSFELHQGEKYVLRGKNGSGKSSILQAILMAAGGDMPAKAKAADREKAAELSAAALCTGAGNAVKQRHVPLQCFAGEIHVASGLKISYVCQDTGALRGGLQAYAEAAGIDLTQLLTILRKLDFSREQFEKPLESYSEGQKKKLLLAASLCESAHLYIWDEPLNYIDIFSRMQLERLLREAAFSMLFVEHDAAFAEQLADHCIVLPEA